MEFEHPLTLGRLIRRYKRFLVDVELDDGELVTAHLPNTGSMKSTNEPGSRVALSRSDKPGRKLPWTLELIEPPGGGWVGVNTVRPNRIVEEAIRVGQIEPLCGYRGIRREVPYGERSRIDLLLEGQAGCCYVEVKNVTYREGRFALFPDAVTARGTRHLAELVRVVAQGHRGVIFFLINRGDCHRFGPAAAIDPQYASALEAAVEKGVEALAYMARVDLNGIAVEKKLPLEIPASA